MFSNTVTISAFIQIYSGFSYELSVRISFKFRNYWAGVIFWVAFGSPEANTIESILPGSIPVSSCFRKSRRLLLVSSGNPLGGSARPKNNRFSCMLLAFSSRSSSFRFSQFCFRYEFSDFKLDNSRLLSSVTFCNRRTEN